jgi:hypothetical protein
MVKQWPDRGEILGLGGLRLMPWWRGGVSADLSKSELAGKFFRMSTINTTIRVGADSAVIIAGLLSRFGKGRRVALTEEPSAPAQVPSLAELTDRVEAARRKLPPSPWATTEEALRDLREGERE